MLNDAAALSLSAPLVASGGFWFPRNSSKQESSAPLQCSYSAFQGFVLIPVPTSFFIKTNNIPHNAHQIPGDSPSSYSELEKLMPFPAKSEGLDSNLVSLYGINNFFFSPSLLDHINMMPKSKHRLQGLPSAAPPTSIKKPPLQFNVLLLIKHKYKQHLPHCNQRSYSFNVKLPYSSREQFLVTQVVFKPNCRNSFIRRISFWYFQAFISKLE